MGTAAESDTPATPVAQTPPAASTVTVTYIVTVAALASPVALAPGAREESATEDAERLSDEEKYAPSKPPVLATGVPVALTTPAELTAEIADDPLANTADEVKALLAPDAKMSLILVSRLEQNGFRVVFNNGCCTISKGKDVIATATMRGRLYHLDLAGTDSANFARPSSAGDSSSAGGSGESGPWVPGGRWNGEVGSRNLSRSA